MDFTFGIITDGRNDNYIQTIIKSIEEEQMPNYQIIIIGNSSIKANNTVVIPFNEYIKPMWITKKKNLITQMAKYENIVYLHDYIHLLPGWYEGHLKYGNDFEVLMDKIENLDGTRFRDWCLWENPFNIYGHLINYNIGLLKNMLC